MRGRAAAARIHGGRSVRHERGEGGAATIEDAIERPRLATVAVVVVGAADGQRVLRRRERADVVQLDAPRPGQPAVIRAQRHEALIALEGSLDQVDQVDIHVIGERAAAREPARDVAIHIDLHDRAAVKGRGRTHAPANGETFAPPPLPRTSWLGRAGTHAGERTSPHSGRLGGMPRRSARPGERRTWRRACPPARQRRPSAGWRRTAGASPRRLADQCGPTTTFVTRRRRG